MKAQLRVSDQFMDSEKASEMYVDEVLDGDGNIQYLDSTVSVRGVIRFDSARGFTRFNISLFPTESPHGS